jgi:hypothetical protein
MISISSYRNEKNDSFSNRLEERLISFLHTDIKNNSFSNRFEERLISFLHIDMKEERHFESCMIIYDLDNHLYNFWIKTSLFFSDSSFFEMRTHRFLKLDIIVFWNETSSLFEMRHHCFFLLIYFDHDVTFYNIYDHWWVSLSHASDDMQRNFSSVWKKSKTIFWWERIENLMKIMNWEIENLIKMTFARSFLSINNLRTIIIQCHFCMNLMTCKENFSSVWKNSKTIFWWERIENLIKMINWEIEDWIKMKSARSSLSINHSRTIIIQCRFYMQLMIFKEIFHLYEKIRKRFSNEKRSRTWSKWWIEKSRTWSKWSLHALLSR